MSAVTPRVGLAAVVAVERRVALGSEEPLDREVAGLGVAALVPRDLDALLLGLAERQREGDLAAAASLVGLGALGCGLRRGVGRVRGIGCLGCFGDRRGGVDRGVAVVVIVTAGHQDDADDRSDDEHDRSDRPPLLQTCSTRSPRPLPVLVA